MESATAASVSQHATVVRDAAVIAHEELEPVGVGLTSTR
jgi:hypothetical protein